ncbi:conserved hypothetical protein [[Clostridium] ultunense Esp]|uniref:DUF86 domain-containing protein n=1 Tax=[Clostridium] ultunense Esp TaxID=1288971 RepID=M1Z7B0_9FIRM|nr:DUF86 domain-containing protein [Schnuerera ultunensis]CCQ93916.1 conserved hypothetical protein [[Clostridium] ultunense Esp]SHD76292.1 conserved protein of unknown function [[Clostridium] ultunense Esp]
MVNKDILYKRIERAQEYILILKDIRENLSLEDFKKDLIIQGSVERYLHLTIEALLDIGNHIIADEGLGKVEVYSDIAKILSLNKYINKEQEEIFVKIIGFRNILVHDYLSIDKDIVYEILENGLGDLEDILREFGKLL